MNNLKKPFIGLRSFNIEEVDIFFGRDDLVDELIEKLKKYRFLAVTGASGYGKSSLVHTGLIDALYSGFIIQAGYKWSIINLRPGNDPLESLAIALLKEFPKEKRYENDINFLTVRLSRSPVAIIEFLEENRDIYKENILIVVDQFEEIFRYKKERTTKKSQALLFVDILLYLNSQNKLPIYNVITMRTDFLGDCAEFEGLPELISKSQFLTPKLTREQCKEAIEKPVKLFGKEIEPKLINYILNELRNYNDQLPLMQHSLMRLWDKAQENNDNVLTLELYKSIGSLKDTLSNHADMIYNSFKTETEKKLIEKIFKALTQVDNEGRGIRRPLKLEKLANIVNADIEQVKEIVDKYRDEGVNFLVPLKSEELINESIIDITHESLIRQWERLKKWVEEESKSRQYYNDLKRATQRYNEEMGELWRGADLKSALEWKEKQNPNYHWSGDDKETFNMVMEFLENSKFKIQKRRYKYFGYICYAKIDLNFAQWLHKKIENYQIPQELLDLYPGLPKSLKRNIFVDTEEIFISDNFSEQISNALKKSEYLIVICSPNAVKSLWVNEEIKYFKKLNRENKILPIIIDGEPNASDDAKECFPKALKYKIDEKGNLTDEKSEVIATDARSYFEKDKVVLKIIAGLLNIDFSSLYYAQEKKNKKKRFILASIFITLFIIIVTYTLQISYAQDKQSELENITKEIASIEYKLDNQELNKTQYATLNKKLQKLIEYKNDIKKQLQILKQYKSDYLEKLEDIKAKQGEKAVVEYILQNITKQEAINEYRDKKKSKELLYIAIELKKADKYKVANELFKKSITLYFDYDNAIEYAKFLQKQNELNEAKNIYKKILSKKLTNEERADVLNNLALLQSKFNLNREALKNYQEALKIYKALALKNPNKYNSGIAETLNNLATLQAKLNQNQKALKNYNEALRRIYKELSSKNPDAYNSNMAMTLNNLAMLQYKLNQNQKALKNFNEALKIRKELALKNPNKYNSGIAEILNNLANLQAKLNQNQDALKNYNEALKIKKELASKNPDAYNPDVAQTLNNLANLQYKLNQNQKALKNYNEALKIYRKLASKNPDAYNYYVATTLNNLALLQAKLNQNQGALKNYNEALKIRKALALKNPDAYNYYVALTLNNLATLQAKLNQNQKALKNYNEALKIRKELALKNPDAYNSDVADTLNNLAIFYYEKLDNYKMGFKYYKEALELYKKLYNKTPNAYGLYYAKELIIGVNYFNEPDKNLKIAKKILLNYKGVPLAEWLLDEIEQLEE